MGELEGAAHPQSSTRVGKLAISVAQFLSNSQKIFTQQLENV